MYKKVITLFIFYISFLGTANAHKIALQTGGYSFNAETSSSTSSLSNLGAYSFQYMVSFYKQLQFHFGYTVNMESTISGDIAYGLDLGIHYYPFTLTHYNSFKTANVSIFVKDKYKPYVGLNFHQRQFQSIRTSYAGFGFEIGSEYAWNNQLNLIGSMRYLSLNGPDQSTASLLEVLLGVVLFF